MKTIKKVSIKFNYEVFLYAGFGFSIFDYFNPIQNVEFLVVGFFLIALFLLAISFEKTTTEETQQK